MTSRNRHIVGLDDQTQLAAFSKYTGIQPIVPPPQSNIQIPVPRRIQPVFRHLCHIMEHSSGIAKVLIRVLSGAAGRTRPIYGHRSTPAVQRPGIVYRQICRLILGEKTMEKISMRFMGGGVLAALLLAHTASLADPVSYRFSTFTQVFGNAPVIPVLDGVALSGTFKIDPDVAAGPTIPNGAILYPGATLDFSTTVAGTPISDPIGFAVVGNDRQFGASPAGDGIILSADPGAPGLPAEFYDLQGLDIGNHRLVNVRMFWLENEAEGDFLIDQTLPEWLPAYSGRLALDFIDLANPVGPVFAFYDLESVVRVVDIDIKPGGDANCLNTDGHGVIPVAVLGDAHFDVLEVEPTSLRFAGLEIRIRGNQGPMCSVDYINDDGYPDLLCQFEDDASNWNLGEGIAELSGALPDGRRFAGETNICVQSRAEG